MLLLGHRNHRITIVSTPFTPLWIRYWPKLRFSDSFDLVARYYNLDRELLQADQRLFSQFKAAHVEKSIKTAAEVIEVLNKNSLHEMTPELIKLKGRVHSGWQTSRSTSCSAARSFSGLLKTSLRWGEIGWVASLPCAFSALMAIK